MGALLCDVDWFVSILYAMRASGATNYCPILQGYRPDGHEGNLKNTVIFVNKRY